MFGPPFKRSFARRVRSRYVSFSVTGTVAQLVSLVKYSHFRSRERSGYVSLAGVLIVSGRRRGGLHVPSFHDDAYRSPRGYGAPPAIASAGRPTETKRSKSASGVTYGWVSVASLFTAKPTGSTDVHPFVPRTAR